MLLAKGPLLTYITDENDFIRRNFEIKRVETLRIIPALLYIIETIPSAQTTVLLTPAVYMLCILCHFQF